ncbi:MAG TPA: adenosine deaminase [Candidatus Angelobacter sp.]|nr:adenosine deaminase [Candidatus Angelobacter sp.]
MESLPKVELHHHLDCSLSYKVVSRLSPGTSEEDYRRVFIAPRKCRDLAQCLTHATPAVKLMQSEESLRLVVEDVFEQLAADRLIYAELRFAPLLHLEQGLSPEAVVATVDKAVERGIEKTGIEARLILCTLRHYTREQSMETVRLVERFRGSRAVALDIAGDEAAFPLAPHKPAYDYARERGIFATAHAGEGAGSGSVWETMRELGPSRIGHGVRSAEDPQLIAELKEREIHLEVCPSSNVQTSMYDTLKRHPVDRLYRAGVPLSINTDSRTMTGTTLAREYRELERAFVWVEADFFKCNFAAIRAAFLPAEVKQRLQSRLVEAHSSSRVSA